MLVEDGRDHRKPRAGSRGGAENYEANHPREVARAALVDQVLAGERLDIRHVFDALGARQQVEPHSPEPVLPRYRAALAGNIVDIAMTFVTGSHYCCVEWRCHLPLHDEDMWRRLRRALTAIGAAPEEFLGQTRRGAALRFAPMQA